MLRSVREMMKFNIKAKDDTFGTASDMYFDDRAWAVRYLIIDTGRWLSERKVLVTPSVLEEPDYSERFFPVSLTREQIENSPSIGKDEPVSRQFETQLHDYYGWRPYWEPGSVAERAVHNPIAPESEYGPGLEGPSNLENLEDVDPHLRSCQEILGYMIHASDGGIGYLHDILVDVDNWMIRYMIIDTKIILPGKLVLIAIPWIDRISWQEASVFVEISRESVENGPEYDPKKVLARQDEEDLFRHYRKPAYWI
jgi:hypothetical protein